MSTQIVPFEFGGEQLRVIAIDGEPWFVLVDLCAVLELSNPRRVAQRIGDDVTQSYPIADSLGRMQPTTIVSEAGMWEVVIRSDKPEAVALRRWITGEVLPQIRKTGSYSKPLTLAERSLALLSELSDEVQRQQAELVEIRPLAAQARTHNLGKGDVNRQDFAREIVKWALSEGFQVKQPQVMEFLGRKLDMFVVGHRSDRGDATLSGERRGLSTTEKGVSTHNGHAYSTGKLTPKGVEYAWSRIETYVREHGHLELPKKEIAA